MNKAKTCNNILIGYLIAMPPNAHEEVVWFNVSVNEVLVVYILNTTNHL